MRSDAAVVMFLAMLTAWPAAAIPLTDEGQGRAVIVISEAALAAETLQLNRNVMAAPAAKVKLAALDLQTFIERMSGARLRLQADTADSRGPRVLVGASRATAALQHLRIPAGLTRERDEDGYVINCRGNTLVLAGNDEGPYHGTHYAVAEFLNRLGVRWIIPDEFGTIVPRRATITFDDVDFLDRPTFRFRTWWCQQPTDMGATEALWKLRNKMQIADDGVIAIPGDSHVRKFMPDAKLAETRPELFARGEDGTPNVHMPNLSNPEAARLVAENMVNVLRAKAEKGESVHSVGMAPDDGIPVDFSPETMKLNQGFTEWVGRRGVSRNPPARGTAQSTRLRYCYAPCVSVQFSHDTRHRPGTSQRFS